MDGMTRPTSSLSRASSLLSVLGLGLLLSVSAVQAASPTITSAKEVDLYYDAAAPGGYQFAYRIVATDTPTSFDAAGLPPDAVVNTSTGWINGNRSIPGRYDVTVRAANAEGAGTATVRFAIHPAATGVISTRGEFTAGQSFSFTVRYNTAVTVTGAPRLTIAVGTDGAAQIKDAVYVSGSGTDELVFRYTVGSGDTDTDGVQLMPSLPDGGSIKDANGLEASTTLPIKYFASGITITGGVAVSTASPASTGATSRLANVSSRLRVVAGDSARSLIAGFVVGGTAPKRVLLRAVGPALGAFGVAGALSDPRLQLYASSGALVADNDNWTGAEVSGAAEAAGAFRLASGTRDAAAVVTLPPGAYTLAVMPNGGDGVALAEVYDLDAEATAGSAGIINLSTRGRVEGEESLLIAGFAVKGAPRRVLIRGVGPALGAFGVTGVLGDPVLKIYRDGQLVGENNDWSTASAEVSAATTASGAFALAAGGKDAAVVLTLEPGAYSAVVSGAGGAAGASLVEVYEVP